MRQDCCYYRWWFWKAAWKVVVVMGGLSGRDIYFIVVYGKSERSYLKSYPSVSLHHVHKANSKWETQYSEFYLPGSSNAGLVFSPSLSAWISINHFNRHDGQTEFKLGQNWNRWGRAFKVRAGCKAEWFIDVTVWETVSFLIPENHTLEPSEVKKRWWWSGWQNVTMMDRNPLRRVYLLLNNTH